ncbi:hypothetical protein Leryth_017997 [Lithospermum erythrorhizon]|nr:hypothetical protein Leryth_017997 [Lithospermum erythrorhizon]
MLVSQPRTTTANLAPVVARRVEAISGTGKNGGIALKSSQLHGLSKNMKCKPIRAVISGGDDKKVVDEAEEKKGQLSSLRRGGDLDVRTVITIRKNIKEKITEKVEDQWESLVTSLGRGIMVQLISEEIDPVTGSGKIEESYVRGWLQRPENHPNIIEYAANLTVPRDFGVPGAILITNFLDKEFHLVQIVVHGFKDGHLFFPADTWIHSRKDNPESRIIFRNQVYLPSETPAGIKDLRREDLLSTRGNGKGERKLHERVYDYDVYNDLGNPDKGEDLARPIVGGKKRPYPRRCRTGRPPMEKDPLSERRIEKPDPVYVPRDEAFEELKQDTFATGRLKAVLHNLIPLIASKLANSDIPFTEFSDIDKLYNDGVPLGKKHDDNQWFVKMMNRLLSVGESLLKYDVPAIIKRKHRLTQKATEAASSSSLTNKTVLSIVNLISIDFIFSASCELSGDRFAWLRDNEFARQALAGVNPVGIELLKEFPILSKLDPAEYGPPESAITKEVIELELSGMRIEQALEEKRLFILDFHDLFLPFVDQINSLPGRKTYASRTILYLFHTFWAH